MRLTTAYFDEFASTIGHPENTRTDRQLLSYFFGCIREFGRPFPTPIEGVQAIDEFIILADATFGLLVITVDQGRGYEALACYRVPPQGTISRHDAINLAITRLQGRLR